MIVERDSRPTRLAAAISLCVTMATMLLTYVLVVEVGAIVGSSAL